MAHIEFNNKNNNIVCRIILILACLYYTTTSFTSIIEVVEAIDPAGNKNVTVSPIRRKLGHQTELGTFLDEVVKNWLGI